MDEQKKNWFKRHLTLTIWGSFIVFGLVVSAFDSPDTTTQKASVYESIPTSTGRILTLPTTTPYTPTYQAPTYYDSTYHTDSNYKYNSRTGYSGDYEYNYDIEGYGGSDDGYYYGEIDISQDGGEGYIYDEDGNEIWIEGEWDGYGEIEAYDENGNYYELEVD